MKPSEKLPVVNENGRDRSRRGSALLWVLALSVILAASMVTMFALARDIGTRSRSEQQKVTSYNQAEREAERFRSWLIRAYLSPEWTDKISAKDYIRVVRRTPVYITDTVFSPALGAYPGDTTPLGGEASVSENILNYAPLRFQPIDPEFRVRIQATSNPDTFYGENQAAWVEFVAEGPGRLVDSDNDGTLDKWELLKESGSAAGLRQGAQRIQVRLAFGQNAEVSGIPSVTRHAVLADSISCMFCHLDVTGNIGTFENFRPGFDGYGSGHTSRIRGTVYSTFGMSSSSTRNSNTTNADGTSKYNVFPFAGIDYSTSTDENVNGYNYKYNPHWRTNIYMRPDLETLNANPQIVNGTVVLPTGREDPNTVSLVYDYYRNEGPNSYVYRSGSEYLLRIYFPNAATGSTYAYRLGDNEGYEEKFPTSTYGTLAAAEAAALARGQDIVRTVPKNMLPEDENGDGSPDFPTLKTTLMRQWASGTLMFGKSIYGADGVPGTADDQMVIVHRPLVTNDNYLVANGSSIETLDGSDYLGYYHKAVNPSDPDQALHNKTADNLTALNVTLGRGYFNTSGVIEEASQVFNGVGIQSVPNFDDPMASTSVRGNVVLKGTPDNPIVIEGNVFIDGDVIISGYVTGRGCIYASRNTYVAGDLYSMNPPDEFDPEDPRFDYRAPGTNGADDPGQPGNPKKWAIEQIQLGRDEVRIAARASAVVGDYTHYLDPPNKDASGNYYGQPGYTPPEPDPLTGQILNNATTTSTSPYYNSYESRDMEAPAFRFLQAYDNLGKSFSDRIAKDGSNLDVRKKVTPTDEPWTWYYVYYDETGTLLDKSPTYIDVRQYWVDMYYYWSYTGTDGVSYPNGWNTIPSAAQQSRGNTSYYESSADLVVDASYLQKRRYDISQNGSLHTSWLLDCEDLANLNPYQVIDAAYTVAAQNDVYWGVTPGEGPWPGDAVSDAHIGDHGRCVKRFVGGGYAGGGYEYTEWRPYVAGYTVPAGTLRTSYPDVRTRDLTMLYNDYLAVPDPKYNATFDNSFDIASYTSSGQYQPGSYQTYDQHMYPSLPYANPNDPDASKAWTASWISDVHYRQLMGVHTATSAYVDADGDPVTDIINPNNVYEAASPLTFIQAGQKDYAMRMQRQHYDSNSWERQYIERGFMTRWDQSDGDYYLTTPSGPNASSYRWVGGDKSGSSNDRITVSQMYDMVENLYQDKQSEDALGDFRPGVDFNSAYAPSYSTFMKAGESWANWDFWPKTIEKTDSDGDGEPDAYTTLDTDHYYMQDNGGHLEVRDKDTGALLGTYNYGDFVAMGQDGHRKKFESINDIHYPGGDGKFGGCAKFDGDTGADNDSINLGQPAEADFNTATDPFTVSVWFKTTSQGSLAAKSESSDRNVQFYMYVSGGRLYGRQGPTGSYTTTSSIGAGLNDDNWHMATYVNDPATGKFTVYLDDGTSYDARNIDPVASNGMDILLGARRNGDNTNYSYEFTGSLDNVRILNRALSPAEISTLYSSNTLPAGADADQLVHLKLDEIEETTVSNDGTLGGEYSFEGDMQWDPGAYENRLLLMKTTESEGWRKVYDRSGTSDVMVGAFLGDYGINKQTEVGVNSVTNNQYWDFINSGPAIYNIPNRMNYMHETAVSNGWPDADMDKNPDLIDLDGDGRIIAKLVDPDDETSVRVVQVQPDGTEIGVIASGNPTDATFIQALVDAKVGAFEAFDINTSLDKHLQTRTGGAYTPKLSPFDYKNGYSPVLKQPQNVDAFIYANRRVGAVSIAGNSNLRVFGGMAAKNVAFLNDASYNTMFREEILKTGDTTDASNVGNADLLKSWEYQNKIAENLANPGTVQNPAHNGIRWVPQVQEDGSIEMTKVRSGNAHKKDMTKMIVDYDFRLTEDGSVGMDGLGDELISIPIGWTLYWIRLNF
ncbi:MAG: LamG domain-containing protein [Planctomycetota bacterium]